MNDQIIDDILATAFEGGINYWCRASTLLVVFLIAHQLPVNGNS